MISPISVRAHLHKSFLKQSLIGALGMLLVLVAITVFLGRYKAAKDLEETAHASAKAFRTRILEGDIKAIQSQLTDVLKLQDGELALILDKKMMPIYKEATARNLPPRCQFVGETCISNFSANAEILAPVYFDQEAKTLFGYLYLSRQVHLDWVFLGLVSLVFMLGYFSVFFGVTRITKSTMMVLAANLENWSLRLNQNPKDLASLSETPFEELIPLKTAIEGLNNQIREYETEAAEKAKLLLLRGIAHDLIGPASQAQLYLATLKAKAASEPIYADLISKAMASVKEVAEIASQVKVLKEFPDPSEQINIADEARIEIAALNESEEIKSKRIKLSFENTDCFGLTTALSRSEVRRIVQNLVYNSVHASRSGSKIDVGVSRDGSHAVLTVQDQGHGIPTHLFEKVFQPDFTLKPGTGTGLGLAIVKYITEARNGVVNLASSSKGTVIQVRIPVFKENEGSNVVL